MKRILLFCVSCILAMTTFAVELNIYASGLKAGGMSADKKVQVDYLLNAPATELEIHVLNADNSVAINLPVTDAALLTKGAHSLSIDVSSLAVGEYRWEVKAGAPSVTEVTMVSDNSSNYILYAPKGVAVNFYPETENFGTVYVSMPTDGGSDGMTSTSKMQTKGVFVWNALLELQNTGNAGYKGGVDKWAAGSPFRIKVAPDGKVFVDGYNEEFHGVWMIDGKFAGNFEKVLTGAGKCYGFDVDTASNGYSFYTMEDIVYQTSGAVKKYVNVQVPYAGAGDTVADIKNLWAQIWSNVALDGRGGMFLSQYRGSDAVGLPILAHLSSKGDFDWFSATAGLGLATTTRGAMAINKDKTLLAVGNRASGNKVSVYNITWESDVPVLTLAYETPAFEGGNNDGVAFDYADNLYSVNSGNELLYVWATPKAENSAVTPAPATQPIKVESTVVAVTGVTLDKTTADMKVGEQLTLIATVAPDNATNKSVAWSSSDAEVAAVNTEGVVSALKAGNATITVTTQDGEKTAACTITITNVDVESIVLDKTAATLYTGETLRLNATVSPVNATNKNIVWTTSDENVATVDAEGLVTAVGVGTATITATTEDGAKTATCLVTIPEGAYPNIYAYGLKLESTNDGVTVGFNLNAPATEVKVLAYDAEGHEYVVATVSGAAAEYQTVALNTADLPAGTYTWAVYAAADLVTEDDPVLVRQYSSMSFASPRGVTIDNNTNSPYFGQIYVSDGGTAVENSGLYVFSPKLESDEQLYTTGWSGSKASPMRVMVGEDGLVYITDWSDNEGNIHIFNPANPTEEKLVFGGVFSGTAGIWNTEDNKFIHGSISGCYVTGTGAERVLYTFDEDYTPAEGNVMCMLRYDIGALETPWAAEPSAVVYNNADKFEQNGDSKILPSVAGGWWISQDRASDSQTIPALIHLSKDGVVDFNSAGAFGGRTRGAVAFNEDQTYCFSAADNAIRVNEVTWTDGVPAIKTLLGIPTTFGSQTGSSCYDIAVDRAGNVYASGDGKSLCIWAVYKDENSCVTPAAEGLTFEVEATGIESLEAGKSLKKGVYSITGQYLGEDIKNLQSGAYIINGKKVIR